MRKEELFTIITLIRLEYNCDVNDYPNLIKKEFNKDISINDIYELFYNETEDYEREARVIEYY